MDIDDAALDQVIRHAGPDDVPGVLRMIRGLADYEDRLEQVRCSESDLSGAMFPDQGEPLVHALVGEADGEVVALATWYPTYSTWQARQCMWLEDLFIDSSQRGTGLGGALLAALAQICVERRYDRLEWSELNWNEPSIAFYRSLGAAQHAEFTTFRLEGHALAELGAP